MAGCGCGDGLTFDGVSSAYKRVLWAVIAINAAMFLVEMAAGQLAGSQALQADALDFLGDTATYTITLLVIGMPLVWRARAALLKGLSLGAMGLWVLGSTAYHVLVLGVPQAEVMGAVGFLALVAVKVVAPPEHRTLAFLRVRAHGFARAKEVLLGPNETAPKRRGRNET